MTDFGQYRAQRVSAAGLVLALHAALISLFMFSRSMVAASTKPELTAFDLPADGALAQQPQPDHPHSDPIVQPVAQVPAPVMEVAMADVMQILPAALPIGNAVAEQMPAIMGGCDLTPQLQDALRQSGEVLRQLPAVPAASRSIANAIVVWNAGWIDPGAGPARAAMSAIRQTIEQSLAASTAACRNQLQLGPRLMYLPGDSGKTTVLAVGSGQWTWQQLADGTALPANDASRVADAASLPQPVAAHPANAPTPAAARAPSGQTPALDALLASLTGKRAPTATPYYP